MKYQEIIARGLEKGLEAVEIYATTSEGMNLRLSHGALETSSLTNIFSMSIRGLLNDKMGYACLESVEEKDVEEALDMVIKSASLLNSTEKEVMYDGQGEYKMVEPQVADYHNYPTSDKIAFLANIEKTILAHDPRIVQVGYCVYQENRQKKVIVNSKGLNLASDFSYIISYAMAVGVEKDQNSTGFGHDIGYEFAKMNSKKIIDDVCSDTLLKLGAGSVKSGSYEVVFKNTVMTDILEAFTSIFSGEAAKKKTTLLLGKENTKVFGDNITIYDDPFVAQGIVKVPFDDEGYPCATKTLVENGVFKGFLHNLATADYFNVAPTGNGFKAGTAGKVQVGPTNLYLAPGDLTRDELIASCQNGIYVTEVEGLHAGLDPVSGNFNLQSIGVQIENGKLTNPVTLFVISGNFFEMLNNVSAIGNDLDEKFLNVAAPSIKIPSLKISGN